MKARIFTCILVCGLLAAGAARAASTSVGIGASAGQDSSMAYTLQITQSYEPWLSNEAMELKPFVELGGFVWTNDDDTLGGASLAPGLKFTLHTNAPFQPFLAGSVGGAILSEDKFDDRDLGSPALFKTKGIAGVEFGRGMRHRIQGEYTHYSTWGLTDNDDGYSTWGLSYSYSF